MEDEQRTFSLILAELSKGNVPGLSKILALQRHFSLWNVLLCLAFRLRKLSFLAATTTQQKCRYKKSIWNFRFNKTRSNLLWHRFCAKCLARVAKFSLFARLGHCFIAECLVTTCNNGCSCLDLRLKWYKGPFVRLLAASVVTYLEGAWAKATLFCNSHSKRNAVTHYSL